MFRSLNLHFIVQPTPNEPIEPSSDDVDSSVIVDSVSEDKVQTTDLTVTDTVNKEDEKVPPDTGERFDYSAFWA